MGAWGPGPLENDGAGDWLVEISDFCSAQVAQALDRDRIDGDWEEVRAACWLLERLGLTDVSPFGHSYVWPPDQLAAQLRQGVDWLTWLRDESGWHEAWDKPADLQASLTAQTATLTQMLTLAEAADVEE